MYLENIYVPSKSRKIKENDVRVGAEGEEVYDINYHLNRKNSTNEIKEIFYKLQEKIQSLPGVEEMINQKTGVTYRTTKSFTRFEFGKSYISILLREPKYKDPKNFVKDITSHMWGYKGRAKIESIKDVEYIFDLIRQSYEETL